jgi:hypothetical protein
MSLRDPQKKKNGMWALTATNPAVVVVYNSVSVESSLVADYTTEELLLSCSPNLLWCGAAIYLESLKLGQIVC